MPAFIRWDATATSSIARAPPVGSAPAPRPHAPEPSATRTGDLPDCGRRSARRVPRKCCAPRARARGRPATACRPEFFLESTCRLGSASASFDAPHRTTNELIVSGTRPLWHAPCPSFKPPLPLPQRHRMHTRKALGTQSAWLHTARPPQAFGRTPRAPPSCADAQGPGPRSCSPLPALPLPPACQPTDRRAARTMAAAARAGCGAVPRPVLATVAPRVPERGCSDARG